MLWTSLEVPCRGTSNGYPQHTFSWRNKKNMWISLLIWSHVLTSEKDSSVFELGQAHSLVNCVPYLQICLKHPGGQVFSTPDFRSLYCTELFIMTIPSTQYDVDNVERDLKYLGPVVQSIVSLMSSLVVKMLTLLVSTISNSQVFLLKKCE